MEKETGDVPKKMAELARDFEDCQVVFTALGEENRQRIVITLLENFGGMRVGELTQYTHLSRPAVSHHLKVLKDAGVVGMFKQGTMNFYHVNENNRLWGQLTQLVGHLNELLADISKKSSDGVCFPNHEAQCE